MLARDRPAKTLEVPGKQRETVTIRQLGWRALRDVTEALAIRRIREHGIAALRKAIEDFGGEAAVRAPT